MTGGGRPTVHTVAKLAGVGVGTVSRVLNNHPSVRGETRERVLAVIEQLNYRPTAQSRRAAAPASHPTVGVVIRRLDQPWESRMLYGVEQALADHEYGLMAFAASTPERVKQVVQPTHLSNQMQGILLCSAAAYRSWNLTERQQPVVRAGSIAQDMDYVAMDNRYGGQIAGEYAATLPGPIVGVWPKKPVPERRLTRTGFAEGVAGAGRQVDLELEIDCEHHAPRIAGEVLDKVLKGALKGSSGATLMVFGDELAHALMIEAQTRGLTVGEDVRIIGYGDHSEAALVGLTTVHQPLEEMASLATGMLLERIREVAEGVSPREQQFRILAPRLALRGSA